MKKKCFLQNRPAIRAFRVVSILTIFDVWCMLSQSRGTLASRYVYLRVPSSLQQSSATRSKYAFYSTCSFCLCDLYPAPSRNSLVFIRLVCFFRSSYFGWRFLLCSRTRYASTWFAYLDSLARLGFSLSPCLWPQNLYLSTMKNQEGHWGYCVMVRPWKAVNYLRNR